LGEIEIRYEEAVASRRQQIARDSPEPSWVGRARIWTWLLNVALGLRAVARFRPLQYLAALIFIVASLGMIVVLWFVITFVFTVTAQVHTGLSDTAEGFLGWLLAPAGVWLVGSGVLGVLLAPIDGEVLAGIAARHHIEIMGPPLTP
jgi:L-asparagine transporter-like permease